MSLYAQYIIYSIGSRYKIYRHKVFKLKLHQHSYARVDFWVPGKLLRFTKSEVGQFCVFFFFLWGGVSLGPHQAVVSGYSWFCICGSHPAILRKHLVQGLNLHLLNAKSALSPLCYHPSQVHRCISNRSGNLRITILSYLSQPSYYRGSILLSVLQIRSHIEYNPLPDQTPHR